MTFYWFLTRFSSEPVNSLLHIKNSEFLPVNKNNATWWYLYPLSAMPSHYTGPSPRIQGLGAKKKMGP